MRSEQQPRTFVPSDANQQLSVIGIGDISRKDAIVGCFLAQLVGFAGEQPDQRIEPEQRRCHARQEQLIQSSRAT